MGKKTVEDFCGIFLNPVAVLVVILLIAIIYVLGGILGAGSSRSNSRMTLLSAIITKADTVSQPPLNEPEIKAELSSTANNPIDNSEQSGEWQTVRMRVTAYCPCRKCCGRYSDGITACGHKIQPGDYFVAADKKYPFGTEMTVAGYKNGQPVRVLDRGGVIRGNRLDVFFHSHEKAIKWGVRYVDVKVWRK